MFEKLKIDMCWAKKMFVEIASCMLKIRTNKVHPKKIDPHIGGIDGVVIVSKEVLNPEEVVWTMLLSDYCCSRG